MIPLRAPLTLRLFPYASAPLRETLQRSTFDVQRPT